MLCRNFFYLIAILLIALFAGCAKKIPSLDLAKGEKILLSDTPFFPQEDYQCGPASLAMILNASGVKVHPDNLTPLTYIPERKGSLQLELIGASRKYQRIPYEIDPEITAILAELRNGSPVLVLQNYGLKSIPVYHYAVVIGAEPETIILHSGSTETLHLDTARFLMSWMQAGAWGIILLKPGELPANLDIDRYIKAVNGYEKIGEKKLAETAYIAGLSKHPDAYSLLFALGNNYLDQRKLIEAETQFRKVLKVDSHNIAAANNLAEVLGKQGNLSAALSVINQAVRNAKEHNSPWLPFVKKTYRELNNQKKSSRQDL